MMLRIHYYDRPFVSWLAGTGPKPFVAELRGLFWWKKIAVGDKFNRLPTAAQRIAIVLHEEGHAVHWHIEKRLWWILTGRYWLQKEKFLTMCRRQELEADLYAARRGYMDALIEVLKNFTPSIDSRYPSNEERIENLLRGFV